MSKWLNAVASSPVDDFTAIGDTIEHFDNYYEEIRKYLDVKGQRVVDVSSKLAGLTDVIYASWAELKGVCQILELRKTAALGKSRKHYNEHYDRVLGANQVENYAKADPAYLSVCELCIQMDFIFEKWAGLSKSLETLSFQVKLIGDLRKVGMEDATI